MLHDFSFSFTGKLLIIILPLVCIPVIIVGYLSYTASIERVTEMSKNELMTQAKKAGEHINNIFESSMMDLQTMAWLPIIEDYYYMKLYRLEAEAKDSREKVKTLFSHFLKRSPYYTRIRFVDKGGDERLCVQANPVFRAMRNVKEAAFFKQSGQSGKNSITISEIFYDTSHNGYVIHLSIPFINIWGEFAGLVILDLDYDKLMKHITDIPIQPPGYAFMLDGRGRTIAHPKYYPYEDDPTRSPEANLRDISRKMMNGEDGWHTYKLSTEKIAAYTPIPVMGWSLAVNLPISEFKKEALQIRERIVKMVLLILIGATVIVSLLSHRSLKPIRTIAKATERIAAGDLNQEIPVNSRDELGKLTVSFNQMTKKLKKVQQELIRSEKLISMGRLSAGVAHEFRNPLNSMKGALVFIRRKRPDDLLVKEYISLTLEEIERLSKFVTEFLSFAKQSTPIPEPLDINKLITDLFKKFEEIFLDRKITLQTKLSRHLPNILADGGQMEQVLYNVVINAIHAMAGGGTLSVITSGPEHESEYDEDAMVLISIKDTGSGIPNRHLQNIFDPFFSTKENGTGLGLPISLGIVESHHGRFTISSREAHGTTVNIKLPLKFESPDCEVWSEA